MILPGWWRSNFLRTELLLAIVLSAGLAIWLAIEPQAFDSFLAGNRSNLYSVLASIWGALLGFVIATVSIVIFASQSPRMDIVRRSAHYDDLWKTFVSTIRVLGVATAASLAGLTFDRDPPTGHPNRVVFVICAGFAILAVLRLARSVWILERVVDIVKRQEVDRRMATPKIRGH